MNTEAPGPPNGPFQSGVTTAPTGLSTGTHPHAAPQGRYLVVLSIAAMGVVFGDIGTSPLYALRECFSGPHGIAPASANILGVLSLIFWSLLLVISVKYLLFVLRADNRGEGGILALMSLIIPVLPATARVQRYLMIAMGLFGAALLYGDGMITPAITVLSAVEGMEVATPAFTPYILPATVFILILLFLVQRKGTAGVGAVFGPVMLFWFVVLAALGLYQTVQAPQVLAAVNPWHGISFFMRNGIHGFLILGSVFLVVTGGEALYADMGHFGARPIKLTWFFVVLPALLLNYFGQGALLLRNPAMADNPLFKMAPGWFLYPVVALATLASVIASQAVISGAFSLTRQAILLGYVPRLKIDHTSEKEIGQIYLPTVNWTLMVCCIWLVLEFRSSSRLAAAYGIAVTTTMVITTMLLFFFFTLKWKINPWIAGLSTAAFLIVDLAFFGANIVKIGHGGWFPLAVAIIIYLLMATWKRGREILSDRLREVTLPVGVLLADVEKRTPIRVRGTAVYMDRLPDGVPPALFHNMKHNKILHERVVFLTVVVDDVPTVSERERQRTENLGFGFYRMTLHYGFMENIDVPAALKRLKVDGRGFEELDTTYFLGRETLIASKRPGMALWRERLFAWMSRTEGRATSFFQIPPGRVVELGIQIEL
ncbi:MAG: potassium transporter Kup [Thermoanaerobaculia bacterium]|nr:potassium transporter Kup [Thermoanaerobaculia bacterium]